MLSFSPYTDPYTDPYLSLILCHAANLLKIRLQVSLWGLKDAIEAFESRYSRRSGFSQQGANAVKHERGYEDREGRGGEMQRSAFLEKLGALQGEWRDLVFIS